MSKGGGKSGGKLLLSLVGFGLGFANPAMFGLAKTATFAGGIMGASLFSSVWSATHNKGMSGDMGSASVTRFDRQQETMSLGGVVPLVYGERIVTGNQTYHKTDADANNLYKHVVFCEGGIEGVVNANAAGYLIPMKNVMGNAVFSVINRKYEDAWCMTRGKTLQLYANGKLKQIALKNQDDVSGDATYWQWQVEIPSLISYINQLGDGWEAFPTSTTSRYPGDVVCGDLTYLGRGERRKDGGDDWRSREQWGDVVGLIVPGSRHHESHHHHLKKRMAWYATFDNYRVKTGYCYNKFVYAVTVSTAGITDGKFHDGDLPSNYQEVGAYTNMEWGEFHFTVSSNINGNPSIEALVKGKKVYDTRTRSYAYSTNPAMCLRDFLLSKTYGGGYWITPDDLDEDSFKAAADYCDAPVKYEMSDGTVIESKRYELNIVIDQRRSVWDWVQDIMASFCAFLVFSKGKLSLRIEHEASISYSFNESSMKDISISQTSIDDCPNQYRIKFIDPKNNWQTATAIVDDYGDQRERGKVITKEVNLEGVTNQSQALRLGRFYRDYNKTCTLQIQFTTGVQAAHLEPSDVISISYKDVLCQAPFRITEIKETENFEYTITARQYNDTIYNDDLGAQITLYNYSTITPTLGVPSKPSNVVASSEYYLDANGTSHTLAKVTWNAPVAAVGISYSVYVQRNDGDWTFCVKTPMTSYEMAANVGDKVRFSVRSVSTDASSLPVYSDTITVADDDAPPTAVRGLMLERDGEQLCIIWDANDEPDLRGYSVTVNGQTIFTKKTEMFVPLVNGTNTVSICAVDNAGNVSEKRTAEKSFDLLPIPVENLMGTANTGYVSLYWNGNADHYIVDGSYHCIVYGTSVLIPVSTAGTYTYTVTAENAYGRSESRLVEVQVDDAGPATTILEMNLFDHIETLDGAAFTEEDGRKVLIKEE